MLAASLVSLGGVGGLKPPEIGKILAGRLVSVGAFIDLSTQGVRGSSRPQDLETALQMLYLTFTEPNADPQAMDLLKRQLSALVANRSQNPQAVFGDRLRALNTGDSYLVRPFTTDSVSALEQEVMTRAYDARFANAADFAFLIVGTFDQAAITPLIEQYIGALPSTGKRTSADKPLDFVFPAAVERIRVEKGKEQKSDTVITFFSDTGGKLEEETMANGAASLLQIRLRDLLREDLGGTYSVSADYSNTLPSPGYGTSTVSFGSSPENADKLTAAVLTEVKRLASEGPTAEDAAKVREQEKRELETSLKQNGYWLGGLQTLITLQRDPSLLASSHERIETITPERLKAAYQKYYPMNRYTVATLVPDPAAVAPAPASPDQRQNRSVRRLIRACEHERIVSHASSFVPIAPLRHRGCDRRRMCWPRSRRARPMHRRSAITASPPSPATCWSSRPKATCGRPPSTAAYPSG